MSGQKKILLVSQGFYPENSPRSFRATELAKEFARQGHDVTVLTTPKAIDISDFANQHKFKVEFTKRVSLKEVNLNSSNKWVYLFNRLIIRLLILLIDYPSIKLTFAFAKVLKKEQNKYDLLISFAVPHTVHWGVAMIWNKYKPAKNWVADCGDPYYLEKLDSFRKLFYFAWIEKWMFRKVDKIALTRHDFKVNYFTEFHNKIIEIPQGFKFEDYQHLPKTYQKNTIPTFAFAGMMAPKYRSPDALMDAFTNYHGDFVFYVYTTTPHLIAKYKSIFKEKLQIMPVIPRQQLLPELAKMDFLVNLEFNPLHQSPSKLIDYALADRPILNFNKENKNIDTEILFEFLSGDYSRKFIVEQKEKYNIVNIAHQFINCIK